jgi:hypothetical protein
MVSAGWDECGREGEETDERERMSEMEMEIEMDGLADIYIYI